MPGPIPTMPVNSVSCPGGANIPPTEAVLKPHQRRPIQLKKGKSSSLITMPTEIILIILGNLEKKKDWAALAGTCRGISSIVGAELDKFNLEDTSSYALWYACAKNNQAVLTRIIANEPNLVNSYFTTSFFHEELDQYLGRNMTPLCVAILAGHKELVESLLEKGANANKPDRKPIQYNQTCRYPIHWAASSKHPSSAAIIDLLAAYSTDMNQMPQLPRVEEPNFEYQKGTDCAPIFQVLLLDKPIQHSSRRHIPTCATTFDDDLRKLQAVRLTQLRALISHGANVNLPYSWDAVTPIFFLLYNLDKYMPSFYYSDYLASGSDKDVQIALINDIVTAFLDVLYAAGADINALGNEYFEYFGNRRARSVAAMFPETPLHAACRLQDCYKPVIFWFLDHGANVNALSKPLVTPLMSYCYGDFADLLLFCRFIRSGAASEEVINRQDALGWTALHHACANMYISTVVKAKTVKILLLYGANPTIVCNKGKRPAAEIDLSISPHRGQKCVVDILDCAVREREDRLKQPKGENVRGVSTVLRRYGLLGDKTTNDGVGALDRSGTGAASGSRSTDASNRRGSRVLARGGNGRTERTLGGQRNAPQFGKDNGHGNGNSYGNDNNNEDVTGAQRQAPQRNQDQFQGGQMPSTRLRGHGGRHNSRGGHRQSGFNTRNSPIRPLSTTASASTAIHSSANSHNFAANSTAAAVPGTANRGFPFRTRARNPPRTSYRGFSRGGRGGL
ncbi:ankyrin repeat-containing domain protein [Xylaria nigripes]|nr:ankyrin repeat-containing domain protein [Xylaria nigripes]